MDFVVARALTGASLGTSGPAIKAIAANMDKNRSAERLGRLRGIELAGFTGGPLIGALLIGPFGLRGAFLIFGGIAMIAFVIVAPKDLPRLPLPTNLGDQVMNCFVFALCEHLYLHRSLCLSQ